MTTCSTGAVFDTATNVSPTRSLGLMALSAARRWSPGKTTTKGSLTRRRNANSGTPRSRRRKAASIFPCERAFASSGEYLTRYHHVDVREFVVQDPQGFGHPGQFVPGQKAQREAWLGGMSDQAGSLACRLDLR